MAIQEAAHDAGYTINKLDIEVTGEVVTKQCDTCNRKVQFLRVAKTGQLLEIKGDLPKGRPIKIRGSASDWGEDRSGSFSPQRHVILKAIETGGG